MNGSKKIKRYLIAAVVLLFAVVGAFAGVQLLSTPEVSVPTEYAASPGGTVIVPINITGVSGAGIGSFGIRLDYDSAVLSSPTVVTTGTLCEGKTVQTFAPPSDGIGKFSAGIGFGFTPTADGILIKVQFNVAAGFTGTSAITIVSDNTKSALATADFEPIVTTWTDGSVKAVDSTGPVTLNVKTNGVANLDIPQGTASLTLTAQVSDSTTGNNNIAAAEYFTGATDGTSGAGTVMTAVDGGFNTVTENVTASVNTAAWTAANSPYTLRVHGQDSEGNWGATATVQVTVYQVPAAPVLTNITSPTRNIQPTMSWAKVTGATTYDLQVATDPGFGTGTIVLDKPALGDVSSYTPATGEAAVDGTYYWRVRASDGIHAGPWTVSTALTIDTTGPSAVTGLTASPVASGDISLVWTNPATDFAGVIVLARTDSAPTLAPVDGTTYAVGSYDVVYAGAATSYSDAPLANNTHRYYTVFAYDSLKNYSPVAAANTTSLDREAPAPVTGFTATAGDTKVTLGWTNPTTPDFRGVLILYKEGSAPTGTPTAGISYTVDGVVGDATVGYVGAGTTTPIPGLTNNKPYYFAIYAYDERPNYSTVASANATPVPFGITTPTTASVDVKVGGTVSFTATGPSGQFKWTADGGTLSATSGANVSWTAPDTVATSPTTYTVTLTDGVSPTLTDTRTIKVYSGVSITDKPTTAPTVLPGTSSATFTATGADSNYTWTVTGPVVVAGGTGATYTFTAPATGAYAGEYTIKVADSRGLSTDSFNVKVPFTMTPSAKNILGNATLPLTVNGTSGTGYTWEIMDSATATAPVANSADYGTWTAATTTTAANTFTPSTTLTATKTFYVRVTVAGDANLTDTNGLNKRIFGPFTIIPTADYTVNVTAGGQPLTGASVAIDYPGKVPVTTLADGKAVFTVPYTGGKYLYTVTAVGYIKKMVSSAEKSVNVALTAVGGTISGIVEDNAGAALVGSTVTAYLPTDLTNQYQATTGAGGAYTLNLPDGAATSGWTVVASMPTYLSEKKTDVALTAGAATVDFTGATDGLTAKVAGSPEVDAGGGTKTLTNVGQTVYVEVPAGGVTTDGYIVITQAAKISTTANATSASPSYVYDVKVTDGTTPLTADAIKRIIITLPIDLSVLKPGDLEKGVFAIYTAANQADLEAGKGAVVPLANIIATDYVGDGVLGSVTFWVDHLSFFGIGSSSSSGVISTNGCFIATAAYGSYMEKHVMILRHFRDSYMLTNDIGRAMVAFYYRTSPPIANYIAKHDVLRAAVRLGLAPIVGVAYLIVNTSAVQKVLILFAMMGLLAGGAVLLVRTRRARRSTV